MHPGNPSQPPPYTPTTSIPVATPDERRPSPVDTVLDYLTGDPARFVPRPIQPQDLGRAAVVFDIGSAPPTPTLDAERYRLRRAARRDWRRRGRQPIPWARRAQCDRWSAPFLDSLSAARRNAGRMLSEDEIYALCPNADHLDEGTLLGLAWTAELGATAYLGGKPIQRQPDFIFLGLPHRVLGRVDQCIPYLTIEGRLHEYSADGVGLDDQPVYPLAQLLQGFSSHSNLSSVSQRGEDAESPKGSPAPSAAKQPVPTEVQDEQRARSFAALSGVVRLNKCLEALSWKVVRARPRQGGHWPEGGEQLTEHVTALLPQLTSLTDQLVPLCRSLGIDLPWVADTATPSHTAPEMTQ